MDDLLRAALSGIAVAGFAAAVVEANKIAAQAIWRVNGLAAETAWVMFTAPLERMNRERQQPQLDAQTENEDNSEPNSESAERNGDES